jgi:hypothetical protein
VYGASPGPLTRGDAALDKPVFARGGDHGLCLQSFDCSLISQVADPKTHDWRSDPALDAWREAQLSNLGARPGVPGPASLIIDSGRGFWPVFKLNKSQPTDSQYEIKDGKRIVVNGPKTKLAESYGRGIERVFNSDNTRNIDRIARLPGSVNHRTGKRAKVIVWNLEATYPIEDFPKEDEPPKPNGGGGETQAFTSFDISKLPARLRNIIKFGRYEDYDSDRSDAVYAAACGLVRANISDEDMIAVLTDKTYKISEHVLEEERKRKGYAQRQVERARKKLVANAITNAPSRVLANSMPASVLSKAKELLKNAMTQT